MCQSVEMRKLNFSVYSKAEVLTEKTQAVDSIFGLDKIPERRKIIDNAEVPSIGIVYITGFSGSGKSTLLRLIEKSRPEAVRPPSVPKKNDAIVDLFSLPLGETIHWLSKFGLGEAYLFKTSARNLSEGQQCRLCLALLLAQKPRVVIVDEFLSFLDRTTAKMVAHNLQKICREQSITLYAATAHEDLVQSLAPDYMIRMDLNATSKTEPCDHYAEKVNLFLDKQNFVIEEGTIEDYESLAHYHYRTTLENPLDWENLVRQIRVVKHEERIIAVRVFTRPFSKGFEKFHFFKVLNERILVSERVVIHPAYRGVGLSRLLEPVDTPSFRCIFAQSALGIYYPFNLKSGFKKVVHPNNTVTEAQNKLMKMVESQLFGTRGIHANLHSAAAMQVLVASIPERAKKKLTALAQKACAEKNFAFTVFLASLADRPCSNKDRSRLDDFFTGIMQAMPESYLGKAIEASLPYPMQAFVKSLHKNRDST